MRLAAISVLMLIATPSFAKTLEDRARDAVSENEKVADDAIAALRAAGPAGRDAFRRVHAERFEEVEAFVARFEARVEPDSDLFGAFDRVCGQLDCRASNLFWYTDLEQAKAASRATGKPILSLHLLGRLDEEYSCANSRFFRATLYPNEAISKTLRENFILHWHTVRPAPKITIDYGDGRTLVRTITGNSIHYVLDAEGRPVDAIPGLYGPKAFLRALADGEQAFAAVKGKTGKTRAITLKAHHDAKAKKALATWSREVSRVKGKQVPAEIGALEAHSDDATWFRLGDDHLDDAELDRATSLHLSSRFGPSAIEAGSRAMGKAVYENPMLRKMRTFQRSAAADGLQNEWRFRTKIRFQLAGNPNQRIEELDAWVYDAVFQTPMWDPWLGLKSDGFGALDES